MEKAVPDEIDRGIGEFIRKRREAIGLSRSDMARALQYKLPNMVTMVERAKTTFPVKRLPDYARVLQIPLHELAEVVFVKTFPFLRGHVRFHDDKHCCVLRKIGEPAVDTSKKTGSDG